MRVLVLSDLQGKLIKIKEPFDLLIICGDVTPSTDHRSEYQREWLKTEFAQWINELPYIDDESKVIMIPGNHDFVFQSISKKRLNEFLDKTNGRLVYLDNEEYSVAHIANHFQDGLSVGIILTSTTNIYPITLTY